ncbi:LPS export ABC transporter periplasmic protein LptC [Plebeiibacterium marinum]|uniref:LPS export ABC transporter periplasmic protein LptC n=1 Tax=Plebeiibacterium marinum TaxID=2992111 RepID=A0AAE3SIC0_9BACT|nr:LPS export ABC transporter periplasmic protein LptC [Plebeiobacterium marinum]MCW3804234.1 LPS export ABC transporter periplasmic protein LptC [Plebeiobacterium marinum]
MKSELSSKKNIIKTASGILLLAVLIFTYACSSNKPEEIKAIEKIQEIPSLELEDYETFVTDSGKVKYHITTPHLLQYDKVEDPYKEFPKGGHIITYDSINVIKSEIKCQYAINHDKEKLWDLRNNVEAINEEGVIFNTEQLFWNEKEKRIYTDKFIKITTEDKIITGYGLEADQSLNNYEIKNVSAVLGVDEEMQ